MHVHESPSSSLPLMSVDIRLCGSIPREDMKACVNTAPCSLHACLSRYGAMDSACFTTVNGSTHNLASEVHSSHLRGFVNPQIVAQAIEPPVWAVPAKGVTRLEPVCEAVGRQSVVDLTSKACFRIGRSPNSDVQLMHATSSRRHAMVFHHSNGACYVVDCGSAHGTYVNGVRIVSPASGGVVVPHKVRRGALIRFGGPGAPSFLLKSFSFSLDEVIEQPSSSDTGELVRRNTRLNALGHAAPSSLREVINVTLQEALFVTRKRSYDNLDSKDTFDEEQMELSSKRIRCTSPLLEPLSPIRLVSPDMQTILSSKPRRVHFSPEHTVNPPLVPHALSHTEN